MSLMISECRVDLWYVIRRYGRARAGVPLDWNSKFNAALLTLGGMGSAADGMRELAVGNIPS
jgi:hypothetical protein